MNIIADESVDGPIVEALRRTGHQVTAIAELVPSLPDEQVLNRANETAAILMTADKDFGELVFRQNKVHGGVVLLRLSGLSSIAKADIVSAVFQRHVAELPKNFTVISPAAVRIRPAAEP